MIMRSTNNKIIPVRLFIGAYSSTPALFVFLATNMLLFGRKNDEFISFSTFLHYLCKR